MTYAVVVFAHSWLRWVVVAALVVLVGLSAHGVVRRRAHAVVDVRAARAATRLADLQLLLGIALYLLLSPQTRAAFADFGAAMKQSTLRFFALEHPTGMVLALAALHVGVAASRRAVDDRTKHRRALVGAALALVCVLVTIPWPFLPYARPLLRLP